MTAAWAGAGKAEAPATWPPVGSLGLPRKAAAEQLARGARSVLAVAWRARGETAPRAARSRRGATEVAALRESAALPESVAARAAPVARSEPAASLRPAASS